MPLLFALGLVALASPLIIVTMLVRLLGCLEPKFLVVQLFAGAFTAGGMVPLCWLWLISWMRSDHLGWAHAGPSPFPSIGGGPFMLWTILVTLSATGICWSAAAWLTVKAHRC
jgi:hypothetical protein